MPRRKSLPLFAAVLVFLTSLCCSGSSRADNSRPNWKILFLGDNGHHRPAERYRQLAPIMKRRGIQFTYTDKMADLNADHLAEYDGLAIYANATHITPSQEKALLDFVANGKGLIPIHCASYCFLNSPKYVELVGAQFQRHGTGVFRTSIGQPKHPIMDGFGGFESWDETYTHHKHNDKNRTVLSYRAGPEGREPWTWIRKHGRGRVFYTAWGHDERTWGNPGFHNLIERGIRWAVGDDPARSGRFSDRPTMTARRTDVKPFEYRPARIAYYPPGRGRGDGPWNRMQLPLSPEESSKHMVTPQGFDVQLFASEPQIRKPISMNWDVRGRLWIAETVDYPNDLQPNREGNDRITICEDTDGDGRADKFQVFADKLSIPTSFAFYRDGIIVHQAPHTLYLKDVDGDDRADERVVLFSGWSTGDTHAGPSNLQWGLDNWLWGMVGYAGFQGDIGNRSLSFRTGFYRFRPDDLAFEFARNTNNNSWGVGFSEEGLLFGSTANGNPSVYLPIPNRYYERVRGWSSSVLGGIARSSRFEPITDRIRQVDHHGNFTAAAGHALYTARTYPPEYWNQTAFVNGPTGHLLATFQLQPNGADFASRNAWNLMASDDEWTAPIMAEVGPDGHVWMIDWYNYIVQHNPTPAGFQRGKGNAYVTDLRDKRHGRIYRIVYREGKSQPWPALDKANSQQLVDALTHSNLFWRRHAQRLLVERGQLDVMGPLIELTLDRNVDDVGLNVGAIHALWTLHGLSALDGSHSEATAAAVKCLSHPSAGVRMNAVKVLPPTLESVSALLAAGLLQDDDSQVRLATLLALADLPIHAETASRLVAFLQSDENLSDRWIIDAAIAAAAQYDRPFLEQASLVDNHPTQLLECATIVAEHFARGEVSRGLGSLIHSLAKSRPNYAAAVVRGLERGWSKGPGGRVGRQVKLSDQDEANLERLFERLPPTSQGTLVTMASAWGSRNLRDYAKRISEKLLATLADADRPIDERRAAVDQLARLLGDGDQGVKRLLDEVTFRTPPELAASIFEAAARHGDEDVHNKIVDQLRDWTPGMRTVALRALLRETAGTKSILGGLARGRLDSSDLTLDQKQSLLRHPNRELAERARELFAMSGGLANPDRVQVLREWLPVTKKTGNAEQGLLVFRKHCAACHVHGSEGKRIGPDLTGMAVHPKTELLTHILDPSRSVEGNFRVYSLATVEGRVLTGLLASETQTSVELFDAEGKRHVVLREDIDELIASRKSLMPEGFEKQISRDEFADLLEFLTKRGRFLPLSLDKAATIVSTRGMFFRRDSQAERLIFRDWKPKTFEGVPFQLVDPREDRVPNVVLLYGPQGTFPPRMPKSVSLDCNSTAKAIHLLSGVSGWGYPLGSKGSVSMVVRLHYADGQTEDHSLRNGIHFADYIRRVDVPESKLAFMLRGQQIRYLVVHPKRDATIERLTLEKGPDQTAPIVMAITLETTQ